MAIGSNNNFKLALLDITASFLPSKSLDRDVFVKPPEDIREGKPYIIWKLKKPLYRLDNTSRKFWLQVKETLIDMGQQFSVIPYYPTSLHEYRLSKLCRNQHSLIHMAAS